MHIIYKKSYALMYYTSIQNDNAYYLIIYIFKLIIFPPQILVEISGLSTE